MRNADYSKVRPADGEPKLNMRSPRPGLWGPTFLVCIVGFAASLVPGFVYTDPFWGVRGFTDKELFATGDSPGVLITTIDSASPAASAGLRGRDRVVKVNGAQAAFGTFDQLLAGIQAGEPVTLDVIRGEQELRLVTEGENPKLEAVLVLDWQFISAPVFLALLLVLIATQPLDPPPLWRACVVLLGGLVVITATVIVEATQGIPWSAIWRSKAISHGVSPAGHYPLTGAALVLGLSLSILGALAVRAVLLHRTLVPGSAISSATGE